MTEAKASEFKQCPVCNTVFCPTTPQQVSCSDACKQYRNYKKQQEHKRAERVKDLALRAKVVGNGSGKREPWRDWPKEAFVNPTPICRRVTGFVQMGSTSLGDEW